MIEVKKLQIIQGDFELKDISFTIPEGEYAVLMGKTGCGKTTIIEALCGLRSVTSGAIFLREKEITRLHPALRDIGYVPQDGALFSTMNVYENIAFALELRGVSKAEKQTRVSEIAERLNITYLLDRGIVKLSGGERQRISLARALVFNPGFLLLDEPLSALDESTHQEMCTVLKNITKDLGVTTLHVTHNTSEATRLADQIFKLNDGCIL